MAEGLRKDREPSPVLGAGAPFEGHGEATYTWVDPYFNIFDEYEKLNEIVMGW